MSILVLKINFTFEQLLSDSIMGYVLHLPRVVVSIILMRYRVNTYYNSAAQENLLWDSQPSSELGCLFCLCQRWIWYWNKFRVQPKSALNNNNTNKIHCNKVTLCATTTTITAGGHNKHIGIRNEQLGQMFKLKHFVATQWSCCRPTTNRLVNKCCHYWTHIHTLHTHTHTLYMHKP